MCLLSGVQVMTWLCVPMRSLQVAAAGLEGQLLGLAALGGHHVDVEVAVVLRR